MPVPIVTPEKQAALEARISALGIRHEVEENFIRGSGKGGQKINKTSSCVHLILPRLNLEVRCQQSRSRELNRFLAWRLLCEKIEALQQGAAREKKDEIEKIRRQKRRRTRRAQQKVLASKRVRGETRANRARIDPRGDE